MRQDETAIADTPEMFLWRGHTSQWVHVWFYVFCALLAAASLWSARYLGWYALAAFAVPVAMWLIRWWMTRATVYELTSQRFRVRSGILNRHLEEVELFRVRDYVMDQPLLLRLIGRGHITMTTSDDSTPRLAVRAIAGVEAVREKLRDAVQRERDRRRVRALDMVDGDHDFPVH